jgi:hypothetical protein
MTIVQSIGPKALAMTALICIQVLIGCVFKLSQHNGKYEYSTASAQTLSEVMKFCISGGLVMKYHSNELKLPVSNGEQSRTSSTWYHKFYLSVLSLHRIIASMPRGVVKGMTLLAVLYGFNNQLMFVVFMWADPGTINLVKAGATLISAVMLWGGLGRVITSGQWLAILLQMCGMIVSQYDPCSASGSGQYSFGVYLTLACTVAVSAFCGVVNDHLAKSYKVSLYSQNLVLYGVGSILNFGLYITRVIASSGAEPAFFHGYTAMACLVVFCNAVIGLVITAVYKYADAVVKTLASSFSTAILLFLGPMLFSSKPLSFVKDIGCAVVFIATYLYMAENPSKSQATKIKDNAEYSKIEDLEAKEFKDTKELKAKDSSSKKRAGPLIGIFMIMLISGLMFLKSGTSSTTLSGPLVKDQVRLPVEPSKNLQMAKIPGRRPSPLSNSIALIRVNRLQLENSQSLIQAYAKLFKKVVFSVRNVALFK